MRERAREKRGDQRPHVKPGGNEVTASDQPAFLILSLACPCPSKQKKDDIDLHLKRHDSVGRSLEGVALSTSYFSFFASCFPTI